VKSRKSSDYEREMLLETGWEMQGRGGLIVWRKAWPQDFKVYRPDGAA
jgi:hypothetical protein